MSMIDEQDARAFLGASDRATRARLLGAIAEPIRAFALSVLSAFRLPEAEDLAQEVLVRLLDNGPTHCSEAPSAVGVVLSWVRTTATNLGIDHFRRRQRNPGPEAWERGTGSEGVALDGNTSAAEGAERATRVRAMLYACYPRGAACFEAELSMLSATGSEIAEELGISRQNAYQLRHRTRTLVRVLVAIDEAPEVTGRELAARLDLPPDEAMRLERRIRHWLARQEGME